MLPVFLGMTGPGTAPAPFTLADEPARAAVIVAAGCSSHPSLGDSTVTRFGYGAMQLAGPRVWGPPKDRGEAIAVLREAVGLGITHIDTSDAYGPRRGASHRSCACRTCITSLTAATTT